MRDDLEEAEQCFAAEAFNACVVMVRRALQTAARKCGAPKRKKLHEQIDWLLAEHHITKGQHRQASAVRYIGNSGAHADIELDDEGEIIVRHVEKAHADSALVLGHSLLDALFVSDAIADAELDRMGKEVP